MFQTSKIGHLASQEEQKWPSRNRDKKALTFFDDSKVEVNENLTKIQVNEEEPKRDLMIS